MFFAAWVISVKFSFMNPSSSSRWVSPKVTGSLVILLNKLGSFFSITDSANAINAA